MAKFTKEGRGLIAILVIALALWCFQKVYDQGRVRWNIQGVPAQTARGIEQATLSFEDEKLLMVKAFEKEKDLIIKEYEERLRLKDKAVRLRKIEIKNLKIKHAAAIDRYKAAIQSVLTYKCSELNLQRVICVDTQ